MKAPVAVVLPPVVLTVTSTVPAVWAGVSTARVLSLITPNDAGVPPKVTPLVWLNSVPVMVTVSPPLALPTTPYV